MKQKDILLIIVVATVSAVFSLLISNATVGAPKNKQQKIVIVAPITSDFTQPNKKYFNAQSVNPTQLIQIQNNTNKKPFN